MSAVIVCRNGSSVEAVCHCPQTCGFMGACMHAWWHAMVLYRMGTCVFSLVCLGDGGLECRMMWKCELEWKQRRGRSSFHTFLKNVRDNIAVILLHLFPFFQHCTLSKCNSGHLLLMQTEGFQLLSKHLRKKDKRWLLIIIKKRRARPETKRSGADHTLNEVTSRLPVSRLVLHCLPQGETLLLFTSPPACRSCMTQPPTWRSSRLTKRSALFLTLKPEPLFSATWLTFSRLLFASVLH